MLQAKYKKGQYFIPTLTTRIISLSECTAVYHENLAKLINLSEDSAFNVTLLLSSHLSLFLFSLWALGKALCFACPLIVYLAMGVTERSHKIADCLFPGHSMPSVCLGQLNTRKGLSELHYFGH